MGLIVAIAFVALFFSFLRSANNTLFCSNFALFFDSPANVSELVATFPIREAIINGIASFNLLTTNANPNITFASANLRVMSRRMRCGFPKKKKKINKKKNK